MAAALGFRQMAVTTPFWGWKRMEHGFVRSNDKDLRRVVDTFGELAGVAETAGVTLLLEPLTFLETTAVETLDDLLLVLDGVGSSALAAMLDTGHLNVTASALAKDPVVYFADHVDRLGSRLRHIHIDDNNGDIDAHLLPGQGNFDFDKGYRVLADGGYDGYLSAELMMFGDNPVPPRPLDLLRETRAIPNAIGMAERHSLVAAEIAQLLPALPWDDLDELVEILCDAGRVYLYAVGRTAGVVRMFAIRAVQIGLDVRLVGDATTTAITADDVLLVASGSGETETVLTIVDQAVAMRVPVWALTAEPDAPLASRAGRVILLPGVAKSAASHGQARSSLQPPGSLFEQMLLVFLEEAVLRLMQHRGVEADYLMTTHANLE